MKVDLKSAARKLKFNEQTLVDSARLLISSKVNGRNIFADVNEACDYRIPEGIERGSAKHAIYLMDMTILDTNVNSDDLHTKALKLYQDRPEFFNPKTMFDADKENLKVMVRKSDNKKESDFAPVPESMFRGDSESSKDDNYEEIFSEKDNVSEDDGKRKRSMILVAPTIDEIIEKGLGHGFSKSLSGRIYRTYRKLVTRDDGDPRKIFKYVKQYDVALSRLDVGKPKQDVFREKRNESFPRYSGFGSGKTAPLLIHKFIREGIIKDIDKRDVPLPFDRWEIKYSIKRGITDIGDESLRKDDYIRDLQALYHDVFLRHDIDPIEFHHALWLLGSEVCLYDDCENMAISKGDQKMCPHDTGCQRYLDINLYRKKGMIKTKSYKQE